MPTAYFRKAKSNFATTLVTGIGTGTGDTITLNSTTGLPTDTEIVLTFNRVTSGGVVNDPSLMERIKGTISGSTLTSYTRGVDGTTEQAHGATVVVEYIPNAADINDSVDGILVQHNADGTHKSALVTTLKASGAEINTGTEDAKIVTPKAVADSKIAITDKTQTFTNKTLVQKVTSYSPAGAGTTTIDLSTGNIHTVTMPADTQTLAISNEVAGQCFLIEINNVTSQGALTWFTTIKWAGGVAPTLTGTNGKRDVFGFRVTGTDTYDGYVVGQNI